MNKANSIDYIEFSTTNLTASKAFFNAVFGWDFVDHGDAYASFKDNNLRGGFAHVNTGVPGGPLVVLYAPDLVPVQEKVIANGGLITLDTFEFPGGKRFHFQEPGGNILAVWSE